LIGNTPRLARRTEALPSIDIPEVDMPPVRLSRPPLSAPRIAASQIPIPSEAPQASIEQSEALIPEDTALAHSPAPASIELLQEVLVPDPFTVGSPIPIEFPRVSPKPEFLPVAPSVADGTEDARAREINEENQPFGAPLPRRRLTRRPNAEVHPHQIPQPRPEPQPTRPRVAQATEGQGKRKRELESVPGTDTKRPEDRRLSEGRKILLTESEELKKKKDKRRSGRRVARRVVAGEIGSFTVDEDQKTEYDKNQFTSSRMRSTEGRDDS
jgi:hypothetical protein